MAKSEWGTKRIGPCGTKFYDFNKNPIICPGCGGKVITNEVNTKTKKNEAEENIKINSEEQILSEDNSNNTDTLETQNHDANNFNVAPSILTPSLSISINSSLFIAVIKLSEKPLKLEG